MKDLLRSIPSVGEVLKENWIDPFIKRSSRAFVQKVLSRFFDELRKRIKEGSVKRIDDSLIKDGFSRFFEREFSPSLRKVVNATGVVVHTNLGRSPLSDSAIRAIAEKASGYSNLEFDLEKGKRGIRYSHVQGLLKELTGCEDAIVVNNNASAVLLVLSSLLRGKKVLVSRGELVEIGGSFRVPEVMEQSGCILVEVGTTNRTHLYDYERAIDDGVGALLKVHKSNYAIVGFSSEVSVGELSGLAKRFGIPLVVDLGSGAFVDLSVYGVRPPEPVVGDVLRDGADVVTISGDKLLGGPQAGIIMGRKDLLDRVKRHPLNRALRIDKLTLIALEETLRSYLMGREIQDIPTLRMIATPYDEILKRSRSFLRKIRKAFGDAVCVDISDDISKVGGGATPLADIVTPVVRLKARDLSTESLERSLRASNPPVVATIRDDRIIFNLRTVLPGEERFILQALKEALGVA